MQTREGRPSATAEPIRIIAVDDHSLLRGALCQLIDSERDLQVVADVGTSERLADLVEHTRAQVVLMDVEMPGHHAPTVVAELVARFPDLHVLMLTMHNDPRLVYELLARGARGYLHKSAPRESLLLAIRAARAREPQLTIAVPRGGVGGQEPQGGGQPVLSAREREVLTLTAAALSNRQIAARLKITEGTVKRHLRNIFGKLGAVSRIDAVNKAVDAHFIQRPQTPGPRPLQ
ncbi:response regulator [Streptomyces sp. NPDC049040]|uniref:response regulator n=1 Tax=Streptomyces sp. NPDC049040 TaxID=3365593 RepID=UPI0037210542